MAPNGLGNPPDLEDPVVEDSANLMHRLGPKLSSPRALRGVGNPTLEPARGWTQDPCRQNLNLPKKACCRHLKPRTDFAAGSATSRTAKAKASKPCGSHESSSTEEFGMISVWDDSDAGSKWPSLQAAPITWSEAQFGP